MRIQGFNEKIMDFYRYYRSGATYLDRLREIMLKRMDNTKPGKYKDPDKDNGKKIGGR